jgi:hypothetical protein
VPRRLNKDELFFDPFSKGHDIHVPKVHARKSYSKALSALLTTDLDKRNFRSENIGRPVRLKCTVARDSVLIEP